MKIAITGGTGFVGRRFARALVEQGHYVVLISRGVDQRDPSILSLGNTTIAKIDLSDVEKLSKAFAGCDAVAHCAGINREIGPQTYRNVHIEGTQNVVEASERTGVRKVALLSFLRARPNCGSAYHESKWAAEEIVRRSGLDFTILKAGVIYGKGDHMLDHLSHAFHTFPVFALVGMQDKPIRPTAVEEVANVLFHSLVNGELSRKTVAVVGPESMRLSEAVKRVAGILKKRPIYFRMPLAFHYALAWILERTMRIPLISIAQTRILSEGITDALPFAEELPDHLKPKITFSEEQITKGLPTRRPFGLADLRLCGR